MSRRDSRSWQSQKMDLLKVCICLRTASFGQCSGIRSFPFRKMRIVVRSLKHLWMQQELILAKSHFEEYNLAEIV